MTGSFRLGIEDDLCQSSPGPICKGNHDQPWREAPEQPSPDCLLVPKHWPDISCAHCQDQTEAKGTAHFMGTLELALTKLHFCSKVSLF